ncbi:hypothetical protein [Macrococcus carouselicus]|uniref:hypothetical protein n=1 Tax=Macrococcus carouselicus TaxID=69969 RepID=UPI0014082782|nr:hypothetical protein [Macrococcus carouselicus]
MNKLQELNKEQIQRIKHLIEELHSDEAISDEEYDELFEYYKKEMLNGYLDQY